LCRRPGSRALPPAGRRLSGSHTNEQSKDYFFVILSAAKNLSFLKPPRFFTPLRSVQNDLNIHSFLTATSYQAASAQTSPWDFP
jgi:hypothetical protein